MFPSIHGIVSQGGAGAGQGGGGVVMWFDFESDAVDAGPPDGWEFVQNHNTPPTYGVTDVDPIAGAKSMYTSGGSGGVYLKVTGFSAADARVDLKIKLSGGFESTHWYLRFVDFDNHVMFRFSTHSTYLQIAQWVGGSVISSVIDNTPRSEGTEYHLRCEANGANLTLTLFDANGNQLSQLTDTTTFTSAGSFLAFFDGAPVNSRVDDLVLTAL